jgi:squalene synthase HpnD/squalene synthase HpnC
MSQVSLAAAYRQCWRIASAHYENFTVASWLLPRRQRWHLAAIYAWARTADDLADEGTATPAERLAWLDAWERQLDDGLAGRPVDPIVVATVDTIRSCGLAVDPFRALLRAFRADADWHDLATDEALLAYCANSANPVGHLVLGLFGHHDAERRALADRICTGLQLANFWQDLSLDVARGRLYLPLATLAGHGIDPEEVRRGQDSPALRAVIEEEVRRARHLLVSGQRLAHLVGPRLAREVRLFAAGGLAIVRKIETAGYDAMGRRPTVSYGERATLVLDVLRGLHPDPAVRAAYEHCAEVTRRSGSSFGVAFRLLSPERRAALHAVYAFCRFVDDVADDATRRDPGLLLGRWRAELEAIYAGSPTHPIGIALADAVRRFPLDRRHFDDLITGVETDLVRRRYETFEELATYCYRVASTVGLLCVEIFGYTRPSARDYARDLGVAFQLTNILRDVREDAERGRIYLPLEDLRRFDVEETDLLAGRWSPRVGALLAFECGRARAYYLRAQGVLAPEDRTTLAPAEAMRRIYARLLDRIEGRRFDVFGARITLASHEKVALALRAWGRGQLAALGA